MFSLQICDEIFYNKKLRNFIVESKIESSTIIFDKKKVLMLRRQVNVSIFVIQSRVTYEDTSLQIIFAYVKL